MSQHLPGVANVDDDVSQIIATVRQQMEEVYTRLRYIDSQLRELQTRMTAT